MTTALANFGNPNSGSRGAVVVAPERLLTFSASLVNSATLALPGAVPGQGSAVSIDNKPNSRYRFRINPERLSIRHEKTEKYVLTKAGYERQYWGNGLSTFQYSGSSGVFRPDITAMQYAAQYPTGFDIRQTNAWLRFKEFESFYRNNGQQNIFMYYQEYGHEWEGSLSGFSFDRAAGKPFYIDYQFTFTGLPIDYPVTTLDGAVAPADAPATQQRLAGGAGMDQGVLPPGTTAAEAASASRLNVTSPGI